ncbi:MAG: hypothetical protein SFV22_20255 [Saprospiraceae bacterium]|nr:hypothetical protein [Saprospiraceae bacterium]
MKHLPFLTLMAFLFGGIFACTQSAPTAEMQKAPAVDMQAAITTLNSHEIPASQALPAMGAWQSARNAMIPVLSQNTTTAPDAKYIAKGFKIPMADIQGILASIGDTSKLFAMLAIQDTSVTIIFQMPDKSGAVKYYDFTQPCPSNCPN